MLVKRVLVFGSAFTTCPVMERLDILARLLRPED